MQTRIFGFTTCRSHASGDLRGFQAAVDDVGVIFDPTGAAREHHPNSPFGHASFHSRSVLASIGAIGIVRSPAAVEAIRPLTHVDLIAFEVDVSPP